MSDSIFTKARVFVRYVPTFKNKITDKTHPEYGGLSSNAKVAITAPIISGRIRSLFSQEELEQLSEAMNNPDVKNLSSTFWKEFSEDKHGMSMSIFPLYLKKEGMILNKSIPEEYIYIKVLEDSPVIASSIDEAKKLDLRFCIIKENEQFKKDLQDISSSKKSYELFIKYENDNKVMTYAIAVASGKNPSLGSDKDFLQKEFWRIKETKQQMFIKILEDELLPQKILISDMLRYKLINRVNGFYHFEKGEKIALDGEKNDLDGAARYFASGIGQEDMLALKAKLDILTKQKK